MKVCFQAVDNETVIGNRVKMGCKDNAHDSFKVVDPDRKTAAA